MTDPVCTESPEVELDADSDCLSEIPSQEEIEEAIEELKQK